MKIDLTWDDITERAEQLRHVIRRNHQIVYAYPIPRGGIPAALAVAAACKGERFEIVEDPIRANIFIDDVIDSGETRTRWMTKYDVPFYALANKLEGPDSPSNWISFPWERMVGDEDGPQDNIRRILQFIGEDPQREGLLKTPDRVVSTYQEIFSGYKQDAEKLLTVFEDDCCDEMVVLTDIEFYSCCEHHMLPFFGRAHVAYIPKDRVVGISKLARLLEIYSRRLQIQERLCENVTEAIDKHLEPLGSACILEAQHFCMTCRGVNKQNSRMITSSLTGKFREPEVRAELFQLIRG